MPIRPERESALALCLVALAFALRAGFAFVLPLYQAPDERAHVDYVLHLVTERRLPVQPALTPLEAFHSWPQSYQPPLAYLSFTPLAALLHQSGARYLTVVRALRLQNALYGALLVGVCFAVARRLAPPGHPLRLLVPLLVACLPGLVANAASVNNDALACLLVSAVWWVWLAVEDERQRIFVAGAFFGAAVLTKLTAFTQAPLLALAPLWLRGRPASEALREAALTAGVALALALPWLARNVALYGDPLAVGAGSFTSQAMVSALAGSGIALPGPAPERALFQLFGRFGVANNLSFAAVPALWLSLAALGATGWLRAPRGVAGLARPRERALCGAASLLAIAGLCAFSLRYYGGWQGRYLYVAALPLALLCAEGLTRWISPGRALRALLALAALLVALNAVLLWRLDRYFETTPGSAWSSRSAL